jgi:hypothetical protein
VKDERDYKDGREYLVGRQKQEYHGKHVKAGNTSHIFPGRNSCHAGDIAVALAVVVVSVRGCKPPSF